MFGNNLAKGCRGSNQILVPQLFEDTHKLGSSISQFNLKLNKTTNSAGMAQAKNLIAASVMGWRMKKIWILGDSRTGRKNL